MENLASQNSVTDGDDVAKVNIDFKRHGSLKVEASMYVILYIYIYKFGTHDYFA